MIHDFKFVLNSLRMVVGFLQALLFWQLHRVLLVSMLEQKNYPASSYIKMSVSSLRVVVEILRVLYSPLTIVAAITFCAI